MKLITLRYAARCRECRLPIAAGGSAWWERGATPVCDGCFTGEDTQGIQEAIDAHIDAHFAEEEAREDPPVSQLGPDALTAEIEACRRLLDRLTAELKTREEVR